jgi:hypothetical protein
MKSKSTPKPQAAQVSAPATVVKTTPPRNSPVPRTSAIAAPKEITHEMIAKRAYEIFIGGTGGDETHNWLQAERELKGL